MKEAQTYKSSLTYRPDIDGLRAVAVLSVLACHVELSKAAGGYVGVDVFFVISGYLISSIIFGEVANSRFSILAFYERRIRRIFPALFAMLLAFTIFTTVYFLPVELVHYSKSLLAATLSSSNFYFLRHSGYFDVSTSKYLLHTWSLAVEEQFYIVFPLFLLLVRRCFPGRLRESVVVLFAVSLIISCIVVHIDQNNAFYMLYTRAWELLFGTMLSLKMFPRMRSTWLRNLATIAGTLAIAIPVVFYKPSTLFPGLSALVPCLGSVLIIGAGESGSSFIGSVLSWRPVAFVGLISYSLYLWHWPVIILHKMGILLTMESVLPRWWAAQISVYGSYKFNQIIEVAVSLILAVLSWWLVERPFRSGRLRLTGKPLFTLAGATMLIFVTYSVWAIQSGGFKGRFSADSVRLASYLDNKDNYSAMRMGTCFISTGSHFEDYNKNICLHQEAGKDNYLLLGDSHSAMLWAALSSSFPNVNLMQASTSSCAPFVHPSGDSACIKMMNYFYQSYLPTHPIRGLILDKRWEAHDLSALTETISWARNHKVPVILLGPVPEYDAPLPRLEAYAVAWNQPNLVSQHRVLGIQNVDAQLQSLAASWDVTYVSLFQAICGSGNSIEYADPEHKVPLMFDEDHLTPPGSILIVRRLMDQGKISLGGKLGR